MIKKDHQLSGIYLVIDPAMEQMELLEKLQAALHAGVRIVQIWNHWPENLSQEDKKSLVRSIHEVIKKYKAILLINNEWQLALETNLDGIHFDYIPEDFDHIRKQISTNCILGLTCSNSLQHVQDAINHHFNYISFCAVFPSPSAVNCEIVSSEIIVEARKRTDMPIFLSGGINPDNINELAAYDFQGIAVISGIMNASLPEESTKNYYNQLKTILQ